MVRVEIFFDHSGDNRVTIKSPTGSRIYFAIAWRTDWNKPEDDVDQEIKRLCYRAYLASGGKRGEWFIPVDMSKEAMQEAYYRANPRERPSAPVKAKKKRIFQEEKSILSPEWTGAKSKPLDIHTKEAVASKRKAPLTEEEVKMLTAVSKVRFPGEECVFGRTKYGKLSFGYTNEYPLQHGKGKSVYLTPEELKLNYEQIILHQSKTEHEKQPS